MKVTMNMQEILATIQRNQQQIDLLTANNTQLVHFLLSQGMIQNLSELPGFNGNGFSRRDGRVPRAGHTAAVAASTTKAASPPCSKGRSPEARKAPGGECEASTGHLECRSRPASG